MPAAPSSQEKRLGEGATLGPSITAPHPSAGTHWFLPVSSGTNPPHTLRSSDKADKRGQGGRSSCFAGSTPLRGPFQFGKEAGGLKLALPAPLCWSGLGCAPEPGNTPLAPPPLYFDFFPRRKQLSRVYKLWEMGGGRPAPDRAEETDQKPGGRGEGREKMSQ